MPSFFLGKKIHNFISNVLEQERFLLTSQPFNPSSQPGHKENLTTTAAPAAATNNGSNSTTNHSSTATATDTRHHHTQSQQQPQIPQQVPYAAVAAAPAAAGPMVEKPKAYRLRSSTSRSHRKRSGTILDKHSIETFGVNADFLRRFVAHYQPDVLTTGEVCQEIVRGLTKRERCSYVQLPQRSPQAAFNSGHVHLGKATVFVSHAWQATFTDLVAALLDYADRHPCKQVFFWIDIFCINQHLVGEKQSLAEDGVVEYRE